MNPLLFKHYAALNISAILSITYMEAKIFFQTRPMLISQLLTPLLYFIFIVTALSETIGNISVNGVLIPYNEYALVGILTMSMMGQMSRVIYRMTVDRRYGFFSLKMQAGINHFLYSFDEYRCYFRLRHAIRCLLPHYPGFSPAFYFIFFYMYVGNRTDQFIFWISLGTVITMFIKTYQMRDMVLTFLIMPLSFSAPSFYVLHDAPSFIQVLALINPLTYQLSAMRAAAFGTVSEVSVMYVLLFSLAGLLLAARVVRNTDLLTNELT